MAERGVLGHGLSWTFEGPRAHHRRPGRRERRDTASMYFRPGFSAIAGRNNPVCARHRPPRQSEPSPGGGCAQVGSLSYLLARIDSNPIFGGYPDSGPGVDRASWGKCGVAVDTVVALTAAASVCARYSRGLRIPSAECGAWLL